MFVYSQGYEIDGSDSSFNIILPHREKTIQILTDYLSLKTLSRSEYYRIFLHYKSNYSKGLKKRKVETTEYSYKNLNDLAIALQDTDLLSATIYYNYQPYESLYPEIQRVMIDNHFKYYHKGKSLDLENPILFDAGSVEDVIDLYFGEKNALASYNWAEDLSDESYVIQIKENPFYTIEFNARMGVPVSHFVYNFKYLSNRYPELKINMKDLIYDLPEYYIVTPSLLCERITVNTNNIGDTLTRIGQTLGFEFYRPSSYKVPEERSRSHVFLTKIGSQGDATNSFQPLDSQTPQYQDLLRWNAKEKAVLAASKGDYKKTPEEFQTFLMKIFHMDIISSQEFQETALLLIRISYKKEFYNGYLRFFRKNSELSVVLDVPYSLKDYVKRALVL